MPEVLPAVCEPGQRSRYSDSLRAERSGDRMPVGARFSAPGPRAYPDSCTMGTGSIPGVKRPGRGVDHPSPSSAEVKERVELYLDSPSEPSWPVLGSTLPLPFTTCNVEKCYKEPITLVRASMCVKGPADIKMLPCAVEQRVN
jgi:hypothetical protein